MKRQIILDTETTGIDPSDGHRIIEIGCVEMINRRLTKSTFHQYVQPDREIDHGAIEVHGITNEFLSDKPRFEDVADKLIQYLAGAELVIHNAPFDVGFLDYEFMRMGQKTRITDICTVFDTLQFAKKKHPGQRNSLDALCRRYDIDNSHRSLHGALLDSEILADVYLLMTGGQTSLFADKTGGKAQDTFAKQPRPAGLNLSIVRASEKEQEAHKVMLGKINEKRETSVDW